MAPGKITALLLDLDGTLIDSRVDLTSSVNAALAAIERPPLTVEQVVPHIGDGLKKLLSDLLGPVTQTELGRAFQAFNAHYADHCTDATCAYPGVDEVLRELACRARLAVVSNKPEAFSKAIITKLGWGNLIAVVLGGDSLPERKPSPEPLFFALNSLDAVTDEALMVGDGVQDMGAARAAGVRACAARYGFGFKPAVLEPAPDFIIDHFSQLKEIVS